MTPPPRCNVCGAIAAVLYRNIATNYKVQIMLTDPVCSDCYDALRSTMLDRRRQVRDDERYRDLVEMMRTVSHYDAMRPLGALE